MDKKAEIFEGQMTGTTKIGELASKLGLSVESAENVTFSSPAIPNIGLEPKVIGKAMSLEAGQMSVPIKGENGVYVVMLDNKSESGEPNIMVTRSSMQRGISAQIDNGAAFNALKENTEIEDNRAKFF
jgi:hypothetical protein